jgi:hypothetical protein
VDGSETSNAIPVMKDLMAKMDDFYIKALPVMIESSKMKRRPADQVF